MKLCQIGGKTDDLPRLGEGDGFNDLMFLPTPVVHMFIKRFSP